MEGITLKYKDENDRLFDKPSYRIIEKYNLVKITEEEFNEQLAINNSPHTISPDEYKALIDVAAGNARAAFIANGDLVEQEYTLAEQEVVAWRDAGSPANDVPKSISAWATATGMTDEQAAQGIETAAQSLTGALLSIRAIRLAGKAAIDNANDNFESVAQPFIDQLNQIRP